MAEIYQYPLLILVGFTVGFINTLAGGGSVISLSFLIFMGLPSSVANGTNRIAIVISNTMAVAGFRSKKVSTTPFSIYLGLSAILGALIGAQIAVDMNNTIFNRVLAIVMIVVLLLIVFKPKLNADEMIEELYGKKLRVSIPVFFVLGIYGGFINAGIGFLIILFLHYYHKMSLVRVNASKVMIVLIYSAASLLVFIFNDKVDWMVGLIMAVGNALGAWVSSRVSVKKGDGFIKTFLVLMILIMAIRLWFFS